MIIEGTKIYSGKDAAKRRDNVAIKADRRKDALAVDAQRQLIYRLHDLQNNVDVAEADLKRVRSEANRIDTEVTKLRNRAMETGRPNPAIQGWLGQLDEMPAMVAASERRLEAACAALKAEKDRQDANARVAAAEAAVEAEMRAEAIERAQRVEDAKAKAREELPASEEAPRGRGRPSKVTA